MFKKAKWIYFSNVDKPDTFSRYINVFHCGGESGTLKISADSGFSAFVNGKLAAFSQYLDYAPFRAVNTHDITPFLKKGENTLKVILWYFGESCSTYKKGNAGLIFEIESNGAVVSASDRKTLSGASPDYISHRCEDITMQLGYNYSVDLKKDDGFLQNDFSLSVQSLALRGFKESYEKSDKYTFFPRPVSNLALLGAAPSKIILSGDFMENGGINDSDTAYRSFLRMSGNGTSREKIAINQDENGKLGETFNAGRLKKDDDCADGVSVIADLFKETTGYLELDFVVDKDCKVIVAYGEHIADGRVRSKIEGRNFSFTVLAKKGRNRFSHYIRRLGLRYLQLYAFCESVTVYELTVNECEYPLTTLPFSARNLLEEEIYNASVKTLKQCVHEHYEDCPWREQAMYIMDSRNQMLCGYRAFKETEMQKACIELMLRGQKDNGLFDLCFPSEIPITIPFFSLILPVIVFEYVENTKDKSVLAAAMPRLTKMIDLFLGRIENGLAKVSFDESEWNFTDWADGLDGYGENSERTEVCLNAYLAISLGAMEKLSEQINGESKRYAEIRKTICDTVYENYFDKNRGLFLTGKKSESIHELTTALCVCAGMAKNEDFAVITKNLVSRNDWVKSTLSMCCFKYDALMKMNGNLASEFIISDLNKTYFAMLKNGATTFYETEKGEADFFGAGSLCHGWSALPIIYYRLLLN